jgi:16S rRNA (guanine966-N2)-methyltransferase
MRVIGGSARGRTLRGPPRARRGEPALRPTSDLVRGVIFDMLDAMGADYSRVLDLYAGTGALGIEALSRGDGTADVIDANLGATGFTERARVHRGAAERVVRRLGGPYTLVLADPPYYDEAAMRTIEDIAGPPLLGEGAVLVLEHHRRTDASQRLGTLALYKSRRHGDTVVSIYRQEENQ